MPSSDSPNSKATIRVAVSQFSDGAGLYSAIQMQLSAIVGNIQTQLNTLDNNFQNHITATVNAHPALAIDLAATDPVTGNDISEPNGLVPGTTVMNFVGAYKDAAPRKPPTLGRDFYASGGFSGLVTWSAMNDTETVGAWSDGSVVRFAKSIVVAPATAQPDSTFSLFPADRGVLALYRSSTDNFSSGVTYLLAVWLGPTSERPPGLASIPSANFDPTLGSQPVFTHTNGMGDMFQLKHRRPRDIFYPGGTPYPAFDERYPYHQVAQVVYSNTLTPYSGQYYGSYLWVHWKEGFPTVMADINGSNLIADLTSQNCYSVIGENSTGRFGVVRRDNSDDATVTHTNVISVTGGPTTKLSGVEYYTGTLNLEVQVVVANFGGSFYTGTAASPPALPDGFESEKSPVEISSPIEGKRPWQVPYYDLQKDADNSYLNLTNAPQNEVVYYHNSISFSSPGGKSSRNGYSVINGIANNPSGLTSVKPEDAGKKILYFNVPGRASTNTREYFEDSTYRYNCEVDLSVYKQTIPSAPDAWDDNVVFESNPDAQNPSNYQEDRYTGLQVIPGNLVYPHTDYTFAEPVGPDYQISDDDFIGDGYARYYIRAFSMPDVSSYGKLRLVGVNLYNIAMATDMFVNYPSTFPGGFSVELRVPKTSTWLNLGLPAGASGNGCLVHAKFLGLTQGVGITDGEAGTLTIDAGGTLEGVEEGDTLLIMSGFSRGMYTITKVQNPGVLKLGSIIGGLLGGGIQEYVYYEIYKGRNVLGTEFTYCTSKSGSGPAFNRAIFAKISIMKDQVSNRSFDMGLLEMEWLPA